MFLLQNTGRSINRSKISNQTGNTGSGNQVNTDFRSIIARAQSADLQLIFDHYSIELDEYNRKCSCPFSFHNDRTPSFNYTKTGNFFNCFGCHTGGGSVEFVSAMEGIEKIEAAKMIINRFYTDENAIQTSYKDYYETQKLWMDFSKIIRDFRKQNLDDKDALIYADKICMAFDKITGKLEINNSGISSLINKLKNKLDQYQCQQH